MTMTSQFAHTTAPPNFFNVVLFLLSSLVTGPNFMSIPSLVLELWQFFFLRVLTRNLEIWKTPVWVLPNIPKSGALDELWILNLARILLMKFYWMLQNVRVTFSELFRENNRGGKYNHSLALIRVNKDNPIYTSRCLEALSLESLCDVISPSLPSHLIFLALQ